MKIFNNIESIIVFNNHNENEFINFVRQIAIENNDEEMSILSFNEAKEYIETYCDNLNIISGFHIYQGEAYPTRTFDVHLYEEDEEGIQTITIASSLLDEALGDKLEIVDGSVEQDIDDSIYFYVDEEFFNLDAETICLEHLDEPFVLITEY